MSSRRGNTFELCIKASAGNWRSDFTIFLSIKSPLLIHEDKDYQELLCGSVYSVVRTARLMEPVGRYENGDNKC